MSDDAARIPAAIIGAASSNDGEECVAGAGDDEEGDAKRSGDDPMGAPTRAGKGGPVLCVTF